MVLWEKRQRRAVHDYYNEYTDQAKFRCPRTNLLEQLDVRLSLRIQWPMEALTASIGHWSRHDDASAIGE